MRHPSTHIPPRGPLDWIAEQAEAGAALDKEVGMTTNKLPTLDSMYREVEKFAKIIQSAGVKLE